MRNSRVLLATLLIISFNTSAQFLDETPENTAPAPKGVEPVIPLDVDDPTYNLWKLSAKPSSLLEVYPHFKFLRSVI